MEAKRGGSTEWLRRWGYITNVNEEFKSASAPFRHRCVGHLGLVGASLGLVMGLFAPCSALSLSRRVWGLGLFGSCLVLFGMFLVGAGSRPRERPRPPEGNLSDPKRASCSRGVRVFGSV